MGTEKKTRSGELKETVFAKRLSCFKCKFLCLGAAAENNLFPICTIQAVQVVIMLAKEHRFKRKILCLDPLLPGVITRLADATKSSKRGSYTDLQGDKAVWFWFGMIVNSQSFR